MGFNILISKIIDSEIGEAMRDTKLWARLGKEAAEAAGQSVRFYTTFIIQTRICYRQINVHENFVC